MPFACAVKVCLVQGLLKTIGLTHYVEIYLWRVRLVAVEGQGKESTACMRMQVYYGNPTCCAWSADGACVAAGGEDDLVTVFSAAEQRVVAWCEGHTSWVTAVRFDPWCVHSILAYGLHA